VMPSQITGGDQGEDNQSRFQYALRILGNPSGYCPGRADRRTCFNRVALLRTKQRV